MDKGRNDNLELKVKLISLIFLLEKQHMHKVCYCYFCCMSGHLEQKTFSVIFFFAPALNAVVK